MKPTGVARVQEPGLASRRTAMRPMGDIAFTYHSIPGDSLGSHATHVFSRGRLLKAGLAFIIASSVVFVSTVVVGNTGAKASNLSPGEAGWGELGRPVTLADAQNTSAQEQAMHSIVDSYGLRKPSPFQPKDMENTTLAWHGRQIMATRARLRPPLSQPQSQRKSGFWPRSNIEARHSQVPSERELGRVGSRVAAGTTSDSQSLASLTERIMTSLPQEEQSGGAGGQSTYDGLLKLDAAWNALKEGKLPQARPIVKEEPDVPAESPEFDVVVCGGTLGVILAAALQVQGLRVALVEAGKLRGRSQDWNVSRKELEELLALGVISQADLDLVIGIEFNPMRVGFPKGEDVWVQDVLNVGIKPEELVSAARRTLESKGGMVFENTPLAAVAVRPGAAVLTLKDGPSSTRTLKAGLLLDCMGQRSPIVSQIRDGQLPDGVAIVVGSCARGFDEQSNTFGDVIYADCLTEPAGDAGCPTQYFWEAFPASSGPRDRTTYLFTYMDLDPARPSVLEIMEDYWKLLPRYQGVELNQLEVQRVLYGLFVSYKDSPLSSGFDRILQVGDASGIQSPLSFGGFGAITRHLGRLTSAVSGAVKADALSKAELSLINPYQPNLRAAWFFQAAMKPPVGSNAQNRMILADDFISKVLVMTFAVMKDEGEEVMQPFLQDVLRVDSLIRTIGSLALRNPLATVDIVASIGPLPIIDFFFHFVAMCAYTAAHSTLTPVLKSIEGQLPQRNAYQLARCLEGWEYGSGLDYTIEPATPMSMEALGRAKLAVETVNAAQSKRQVAGAGTRP